MQVQDTGTPVVLQSSQTCSHKRTHLRTAPNLAGHLGLGLHVCTSSFFKESRRSLVPTEWATTVWMQLVIRGPDIQKRPYPLQGAAPKTKAPPGRHLCGLERVSRRDISLPTGTAIWQRSAPKAPACKRKRREAFFLSFKKRQEAAAALQRICITSL